MVNRWIIHIYSYEYNICGISSGITTEEAVKKFLKACIKVMIDKPKGYSFNTLPFFHPEPGKTIDCMVNDYYNSMDEMGITCDAVGLIFNDFMAEVGIIGRTPHNNDCTLIKPGNYDPFITNLYRY